MMQRSKRWISLIMAVIMAGSLMIIPVSASGEGETVQEQTDVSSVLDSVLNPEPVEEIEDTDIPEVGVIPLLDGDAEEDTRDLTGYRSYVLNVLEASSTGMPEADKAAALAAINNAADVDEVEQSVDGMIEMAVLLTYDDWVSAGKPTGELLAEYQSYVKACVAAYVESETEAAAVETAVDACTTVAAVEAVAGVAALIQAEKCFGYDDWLAEGKPFGPDTGEDEAAAEELAKYKAYALVCIAAAAPADAQTLETAVNASTTTGEVEAAVSALILAEKCLSYNDWVAAERPETAPGPSASQVAQWLAEYKTYVKAYIAVLTPEADREAAESAVDACTTAEAVEALSAVKALIEAENTCLGYEEWLEAETPEATPNAVVHTVTFYDGMEVMLSEFVVEGEKPLETPVKNIAGANIAGWFASNSAFVDPADTAVTKDVSYYVWYAPVLETEAHDRYVNGVGNNCFNPNGYLTRYEAVTILYNLMTVKENGPYTRSFSDVPANHWAADAVAALSSHMIINGYDNGGFYGEACVKRVEFVTMLTRIMGLAEGELETTFPDVPSDYWGRIYIANAQQKGWLKGNDDGKVCPEDNITRAEAVTIMNRCLNRIADKATIQNSTDMTNYSDVSTSDWFYWEVKEASVSHTYKHTTSGGTITETWNTYVASEERLTPGFHTIDGVTYYVSSETKKLVYLNKGLNEVDGLVLFALQDGYAVAVNISSYMETHSQGSRIYQLGATDMAFYWDDTEKKAVYLTEGLNKLGNFYYYAAQDGYFITTSMAEDSVVELGGDLYISGINFTIVTTCDEYYTGSKVVRDLAGSTYEFQHNMYYVNEDYTLARDEWVGYLYFDENGKYTTENATLDAYVYNAIYDIIENNALSPEKKLLSVYYRIRGGNGATPGKAMLAYYTWSDGYARRRYDAQDHYTWLQNVTIKAFEYKRGSCYYWAGMYLYMARRLGFQSYAVVGNVWQDQPASAVPRHCWCMIYWDGKWHISDVEVEWGYLVGYYTYGKSYYYNLFDQAVPYESISSYTNPEWSTVKYFFKNE